MIYDGVVDALGIGDHDGLKAKAVEQHMAENGPPPSAANSLGVVHTSPAGGMGSLWRMDYGNSVSGSYKPTYESARILTPRPANDK